MNKNSEEILVKYYLALIIEKLKAEGIPQVSILRIVTDLEKQIYADMASNITSELSEEELSEVDTINPETILPEDALKSFGISKSDISIHMVHALEDYLAALPGNIAAIKEKYGVTTS